MRVLLLCLSCLLASVAAGDFEELFRTDNTVFLKDEAKWKVLFNCLMDLGPCEGYQNVKDTLSKLIINKCEGCTGEQKEIFYKTLDEFGKKYPEDYRKLYEKFLPGSDQVKSLSVKPL